MMSSLFGEAGETKRFLRKGKRSKQEPQQSKLNGFLKPSAVSSRSSQKEEDSMEIEAHAFKGRSQRVKKNESYSGETSNSVSSGFLGELKELEVKERDGGKENKWKSDSISQEVLKKSNLIFIRGPRKLQCDEESQSESFGTSRKNSKEFKKENSKEESHTGKPKEQKKQRETKGMGDNHPKPKANSAPSSNLGLNVEEAPNKPAYLSGKTTKTNNEMMIESEESRAPGLGPLTKRNAQGKNTPVFKPTPIEKFFGKGTSSSEKKPKEGFSAFETKNAKKANLKSKKTTKNELLTQSKLPGAKPTAKELLEKSQKNPVAPAKSGKSSGFLKNIKVVLNSNSKSLPSSSMLSKCEFYRECYSSSFHESMKSSTPALVPFLNHLNGLCVSLGLSKSDATALTDFGLLRKACEKKSALWSMKYKPFFVEEILNKFNTNRIRLWLSCFKRAQNIRSNYKRSYGDNYSSHSSTGHKNEVYEEIINDILIQEENHHSSKSSKDIKTMDQAGFKSFSFECLLLLGKPGMGKSLHVKALCHSYMIEVIEVDPFFPEKLKGDMVEATQSNNMTAGSTQESSYENSGYDFRPPRIMLVHSFEKFEENPKRLGDLMELVKKSKIPIVLLADRLPECVGTLSKKQTIDILKFEQDPEVFITAFFCVIFTLEQFLQRKPTSTPVKQIGTIEPSEKCFSKDDDLSVLYNTHGEDCVNMIKSQIEFEVADGDSEEETTKKMDKCYSEVVKRLQSISKFDYHAGFSTVQWGLPLSQCFEVDTELKDFPKSDLESIYLRDMYLSSAGNESALRAKVLWVLIEGAIKEQVL